MVTPNMMNAMKQHPVLINGEKRVVQDGKYHFRISRIALFEYPLSLSMVFISLGSSLSKTIWPSCFKIWIVPKGEKLS